MRSHQRRDRLNEAVSGEQVRELSESPSDAMRLVRDCLDDLPTEQCAILTLFYLEGMSIQEIAVILETAEGTVKSRLFHARANLKAIILSTTQFQTAKHPSS